MKGFILFFALLWIFALGAKAQTPLSLPGVDATTYTLWQKKDWKELLSVGKQALNQKIDFYYLRVRMGIAYFEIKNYQMASYHFEKAYSMNSQEQFLKEYLYYSYQYAGRESDARVLLSTFSSSLQEKLGKGSNKNIDLISLFYGINAFDSNTEIDNFPNNYAAPMDGYQQISKSLNIINLGLSHNLSARFTLNHSYTNINKTSFDFIKNTSGTQTVENQNTYIHQYYIAGNTHISKGLNITLGAHVINIRYPYEVSYFRQGQQITTTETLSNFDYLGFVSAYKNLGYFTIGAFVAGAKLNSATQLQGDINLTAYPLGNLFLYTSSTASYQMETYSNQNNRNTFVFNQLIGFKITKFLWGEGFVTFGNLRNFIAANGATIYNGSETITGRFGGNIIVLISPKVRVVANYTSYNIQSTFTDGQDFSIEYNPIQYKNNSITGGLIWNF